MFQNKKQELLKKIENNDLNFTLEDIFIFERDSEARIAIFTKIFKGTSLLNVGNVGYIIFGVINTEDSVNDLKKATEITGVTLEEFLSKIILQPNVYLNYAYKSKQELEEERNPHKNELDQICINAMLNPNFTLKNSIQTPVELYKLMTDYIVPYNRIDLLIDIWPNFRGYAPPYSIGYKQFTNLLDKKRETNGKLSLEEELIYASVTSDITYLLNLLNSFDEIPSTNKILWESLIASIENRDLEISIKLYETCLNKEFIDFKGYYYEIFLERNGNMNKLKNALLHGSKLSSLSSLKNTTDKELISLLAKQGLDIWSLKNKLPDIEIIALIEENKDKYKNYKIKSTTEFEGMTIPIVTKLLEIKGINTLDFISIYDLFDKDIAYFYTPLIIDFFEKNSLNAYIINDRLKEKINNDIVFGYQFLEDSYEFIVNNEELIDIYTKDDYFIEILLNKVNHNENLSHFYNHDNYLKLRDFLIRKYQLNPTNMDKIESYFGSEIIKYISSDNIRKIINMSSEEIDKLFEILPKVTYTKSDIERLFDILKQYEFYRTSEAPLIFNNLMHAIEDKNEKAYSDLIKKEIIPYLNSKFESKYPQLISTDYYQMLMEIYHKMIDINTENSTKEELLEKLHTITNYYIAVKREEYRKLFDYRKELRLYTVPIKGNERIILKEALKDYNIEGRTLIEELIKNTGCDKTLILDTIHFLVDEEYIDPGIIKTKEERVEYIKIINKTLRDEKTNHYVHEYLQILHNSGVMLKLEYLNPPERNDIYKLLNEINLTVLRSKVLNNPEILESLKNIMIKYKLHKIPLEFNKMLNSTTINLPDAINTLQFLVYYYIVYGKEIRKLNPGENLDLPLIDILQYANMLAGTSNVYTMVLGEEDASLIKRNPKPNQALNKTEGNQRLEEATKLTQKCFERKLSPVPPLNEVLTINGKKIRVVVGNFTHPSNLTHGERTRACMRIGGLGESLFYFVLTDNHGFHIRFEDEETHEYISRVSGFRNGNTVFLNQLRESCNPNLYSNDEIVMACEMIAQKLIEATKNSGYPIENVVCSEAFATRGMQTESFNGINIKEGLPSFYSDIKSYGVVMASSGKKGELVPISTDKTNEIMYPVARERIIETENANEFNSYINRINGINALRSGIDIETLMPNEYENGFVYGIANQDFYVYLDELGNIHEGLIDIDKRAKEEMEKAKEELRNKLMTESENYGL